MGKDYESVAVHCRHTDCIYRGCLRGYNIPFCAYILEEKHPRGCKISECDKYKTGKRVRARMTPMIYIEWERELYE